MPLSLSSLAWATRPLLRNDFVYDVVMTRSLGFLVTRRTLKATRTQLNDIRRRFGRGVRIYALPGGQQMEFDLSQDLDAFMYDHLTRYGSYEREVTATVSDLIAEGGGTTTFIDVGANVGYFTTLLSRAASTVYAFEPVPAIFERLSRNISLNGCNNVHAFQCAVSREAGQLRLYESEISSGHDSTVKRSEHHSSFLVEAVALDEVIIRGDTTANDIVMKVDTEGSEMDVVLGALGLIRAGKVRAIILEWARGIYPQVSDLRDRFSLYSAIGSVELIGGDDGTRVVRDRHELPDFCNLLIRVRR
jgi:FkbM family methyltransferase